MKKIAFFLGSDTLVYLCKPIIQKLLGEAELFILFPRFTNERARETYNKLFPEHLDLICTEHSAFKHGLDYLVCANDWGAEIKLLILWARKKAVTTIAIQESVVDLSICSDRYLYADIVFSQGEVSKTLLRRNNVIVTGNPRYEKISFQHPKETHALINCNFTYGVFENSRDQWIRDVTNALNIAGVAFKISKHPRDFSNLEGLETHVIPSGAGVVHEQVQDSAFLITRFSSLIHESILMGRPVIYYNPHGENMGYAFGADGKVLQEISHESLLVDAIKKVKTLNCSPNTFNKYIHQHMENYNSDVTPSKIIKDKLVGDWEVEKCTRSIYITLEVYILTKLIIFRLLKFIGLK
jgi:hypothetical protein